MAVWFKVFWPRIEGFVFFVFLFNPTTAQLSYSRHFTSVHIHLGFRDLHRPLKITIQCVTSLTTSKHHAELIDMKTLTPPFGRVVRLLSHIWTRPVPYQAFASHSCTKLSFPKCISPPRKVSLGITAYLKGIKNVLDRLAASLIPRSHSVLSFTWEHWQTSTHNKTNCQS